MKNQLNQYIHNEPKLNGALIGISIRSAITGGKLYERIADTRLAPASNMKLLTAAAALSVLGEDYTFSTNIGTDGSLNGNKLHGNLYVIGKGDPTLLPADFENFAKEIRARGVTEIEGDIIGDDTWYDNVRLSADLNWSDEHYYYGSQISALTASPDEDYNSGSVIIEVAPGSEVGEKPFITVSPKTDYIQIQNEATMVGSNQEVKLTIEREHGGNIIIIKGTIPVGAENSQEWISVWGPTGYAMDLFQQALDNEGISWTGNVKIAQAPENTNLLIAHKSVSLAELLVPFMKLSNNGHAEILVKEMGKVVHGVGSWEKGIEGMEAELRKFGVNTDTISIRDGSGISHFNLIPPNEITELLLAIQDEEWFPAYLNALPVAGVEDRMIGGTLGDRMHGLSVQAKTGTIHGASTLSGYIATLTEGRLLFSIMINNLLDEDEGKVIEDALLEIIGDEG
ncbi:D-alanyl-D-alanine carboxypeptidase/D-alanyl-D-alanine-endopeptidase [Virgibacillus sp. NKC19-16]|uniref:D-alanyl-D-alanine carboxypeptidase/D-alanyl-D-alanine endopeptidase n=1 Tax=Virgibacillus salidurans TaxID=2831673 RepID=UPI001F3BF513|nr:D-alanyl-D-alanine carboxypeptidase/D-alanyl-D-alanine-endopeptidase [Virgibacillus sp. NKC19-16]UJL47728.1 D-alanyl-D-alanine carboxypeptidase/D-alanyl-D-alanine-endopeptidase [Virgibacillus sp. NKC19-16]